MHGMRVVNLYIYHFFLLIYVIIYLYVTYCIIIFIMKFLNASATDMRYFSWEKFWTSLVHNNLVHLSQMLMLNSSVYF